MRYIKKIIIENFQSHKYSEIELDPYLNVIVGPSDHGKTAIIRALRWALFNEPSGDFFIREGERECSVTVVFSDNSKVKRYRSKSKNTYFLYNEEGEEMVFEGFGTKVPKEITAQTSMRKISFDGAQSNLINIAEQLEGPFLLSEKNSTKANAIGRLVGVHIIDDAIKDTLKDVRNLNIKRRSHEEMVNKLEEELEEYGYLDSLIATKDKLINIKVKIKNTQVRLDRLLQISKVLKSLDEEISLLDKYLIRLKNVDKVADIEERLTGIFKIYNYISNRYNRLEAIKKNIILDKNIIHGLKDIERCSEIKDLVNENIIRMNKLISINKSIKDTNDKLLNSKRILAYLKEVDKVDENIVAAENNYAKMAKLTSIKYKLDSINKSIAIGKEYVDKLSQIDKLSITENSLTSKYKKLKALLEYNDKYNGISKSKLEIEKNLEELDGKIILLLNRYKTLLTKLKVCPLCFSNIDKYKIEEIVNNFR